MSFAPALPQGSPVAAPLDTSGARGDSSFGELFAAGREPSAEAEVRVGLYVEEHTTREKELTVQPEIAPETGLKSEDGDRPEPAGEVEKSARSAQHNSEASVSGSEVSGSWCSGSDEDDEDDDDDDDDEEVTGSADGFSLSDCMLSGEEESDDKHQHHHNQPLSHRRRSSIAGRRRSSVEGAASATATTAERGQEPSSTPLASAAAGAETSEDEEVDLEQSTVVMPAEATVLEDAAAAAPSLSSPSLSSPAEAATPGPSPPGPEALAAAPACPFATPAPCTPAEPPVERQASPLPEFVPWTLPSWPAVAPLPVPVGEHSTSDAAGARRATAAAAPRLPPFRRDQIVWAEDSSAPKGCATRRWPAKVKGATKMAGSAGWAIHVAFFGYLDKKSVSPAPHRCPLGKRVLFFSSPHQKCLQL